MSKRYKPQTITLLQDIVVKAGTMLSIEPPFKRETMCDYVSVLIAHGKDRTSEWTMPLDDAVSYGLVSAPVEKKARTT